MRYISLVAVVFVGLVTGPAHGQVKNQRATREADPDPYVARDRSSRLRFRIGLRIDASGAVQRATATVVNPIDWPEQQLTLVSEDIPFGIQVETRKTGSTAQQMLLRIPVMQAGSSAVCTRTYEMTRWTQRVKPEARSQLAAAAPERFRSLLAPSDGIESTHAEIRKFANEAIADKTDVWDRVEAIFQATRAKIKYTQGPFAGALAGLRSGKGDCEELSCLFIASCRASGIPARVVWGPEHTWSEFALSDSDGKLVWLPSDPSKERVLGVINHFTPILQKGDHFSVPEMPGKPQRYLAPMCVGLGSTPRLEAIESIEPLEDAIREQRL